MNKPVHQKISLDPFVIRFDGLMEITKRYGKHLDVFLLMFSESFGVVPSSKNSTICHNVMYLTS
jgi:hypothetical protein